MELEKWTPAGVIDRELSLDDNTQVLLEEMPGDGYRRFLLGFGGGEVLITVLGEETLRVSVQREKGYCVFEFPWKEWEGFFSSGEHQMRDLLAGIYEDPVISELTREQAAGLLGINVD